MHIGSITARELKARLDRQEELVLVDVREPWEHEVARLEGARLLPLGELPARLGELPQNKELVFLCHHGVRSYRACLVAAAHGLRATNLEGGIAAWSSEVDPAVPQY